MLIHQIGVNQVPFDGFADASAKGLGGLPAQLDVMLACIDGVMAVMPRACGHIGDLAGISAIGLGPHLIERLANDLHDLDSGLFVPATHVLDLTQEPGFKHAAACAAMVFDIQPIANLHNVPLDWQRLARESIDDHQQDEFSGKWWGRRFGAKRGLGDHCPPCLSCTGCWACCGGLR